MCIMCLRVVSADTPQRVAIVRCAVQVEGIKPLGQAGRKGVENALIKWLWTVTLDQCQQEGGEREIIENFGRKHLEPLVGREIYL